MPKNTYPAIIALGDDLHSGIAVGNAAAALALDAAVRRGVIPLYVAEAISCEVDDIIQNNVIEAFNPPEVVH